MDNLLIYKKNSFFIKLIFLITFVLIVSFFIFSKSEEIILKSRDEKIKNLFNQFLTEVHLSHVVNQKTIYGKQIKMISLKSVDKLVIKDSIFDNSFIVKKISDQIKTDVFIAIGNDGKTWGMVTELNSESGQYWCVDTKAIPKKTNSNQKHWIDSDKIECQ